MKSNFYKDFEEAAKALTREIAERAYAIARYDVQEDFNNELSAYVADVTGHSNLANTCFVEVELDSYNYLKVNKYTESAYVAGVFSSNSSYHRGFEGWEIVRKFKTMSRDEFWDMRLSGEDEDHRNYGGVDSDWVTDNFWDGIVYSTNGWPLSNADFLAVYKSHEISAATAVEDYINAYIGQGRFPRHIQNAINKIIK